MSDFSVYSQSGAQLSKLPNQSTRKKFATRDDAVRFAVHYLITSRRSGTKSPIQRDPDLQLLILEYSSPYKSKIVAIIGKDSVESLRVNLPEKSKINPIELSEKNLEEFRNKNCRVCGSIVCSGSDDTREGCRFFRETFGYASTQE